jgi:predicted Fe-Mo cluster-binding NifX family protein
VCTIPDDLLKNTSNLKLVETVRQINADAVIVANATELRGAEVLYAAGADYVFLPRVETAKAVEVAIEKALNGEIESYRNAMAADRGEVHSRREVFP